MNNIEELKTEFLSFFKMEMKEYFSSDLALDKACLYSLFAGGKRIRPILTMIIAKLTGGDLNIAKCFGAAIEMIHTYSLIHDDLPAMDDDDFRRGKPTCHKAYGEALAILAGDALLTEAPLFIANSKITKECDRAIIVDVISELLNASGRQGMIKGQVQDVLNEDMDHSDLSVNEKLVLIKEIHNNKTGKLFSLSCVLGILSKKKENDISRDTMENFRKFGLDLGLLFQVRDDIIDVTKDFSVLGKTPGKDEASGKLTYVSILGLDGAKKMAKDLHHSCLQNLEQFKHPGRYNNSSLELLKGLLDILKDGIY